MTNGHGAHGSGGPPFLFNSFTPARSPRATALTWWFLSWTCRTAATSLSAEADSIAVLQNLRKARPSTPKGERRPRPRVGAAGGRSQQGNEWRTLLCPITGSPQEIVLSLSIFSPILSCIPDTPCVPYMPTLGWFEGSM